MKKYKMNKLHFDRLVCWKISHPTVLYISHHLEEVLKRHDIKLFETNLLCELYIYNTHTLYFATVMCLLSGTAA